MVKTTCFSLKMKTVKLSPGRSVVHSSGSLFFHRCQKRFAGVIEFFQLNGGVKIERKLLCGQRSNRGWMCISGRVW